MKRFYAMFGLLSLLLVSIGAEAGDKKPAPLPDPPKPEVKVPVWNGHKLSRVPDKKIGHQTYFHPAKFRLSAPPPSADMRPKLPPVYDQGSLGSCVDNGTSFAYEWCLMKQQVPNPWTPSRLYGYYYARLIEGTVNQDSGSSIQDGVLSMAKYGAVPEPEWPYDVSKFTVQPPAKVRADAVPNVITDYARCPDNSAPDIKAALASGNPVIIGFDVYQNFPNDSATNGVVPMPAGRIEGGHCVVLVGYDDTGVLGHKGYYVFRNSWSASWGDKGYGYMPRAVIENSRYSSDFWIIASVPVGGVTPPTPPTPPSPAFDVGITLLTKTVQVPTGWKAFRGSSRQTSVNTDPASKSVVIPPGWKVVAPFHELQGSQGIKGVNWSEIISKVEDLLTKYGPAAAPIIDALIESADLPPYVKGIIEAIVNATLAKKKAG